MKFTFTFTLLSACLLLTGCTGLGLNSNTELAFYEPDPFLTDGGVTGDNYPAEPMASGPVGHARIMDANLSDAPTAQYPAVVDVAMPLIPTGVNDTKPAGSSSQVPDDLLMDDGTHRPEIVVVSHSDAIEFGADPFATQAQTGRQPVAVAAVDPMLTTVSSQDFSTPIHSQTVVEKVGIPTRTALKPAEIQTTPSTEGSATIGWQATR